MERLLLILQHTRPHVFMPLLARNVIKHARHSLLSTIVLEGHLSTSVSYMPGYMYICTKTLTYICEDFTHFATTRLNYRDGIVTPPFCRTLTQGFVMHIFTKDHTCYMWHTECNTNIKVDSLLLNWKHNFLWLQLANHSGCNYLDSVIFSWSNTIDLYRPLSYKPNNPNVYCNFRPQMFKTFSLVWHLSMCSGVPRCAYKIY